MPQRIHRAISINTLCLEPAPLGQQADAVARLGARGISPTLDQVGDLGAAQAASLFRDAGLAVATLSHMAFGFATPDDARAARLRLEAISAYVSRPDFSALAATFKRVANIVEKQAKDVARAPVDANKLTDDPEKALHAEVSKVSAAFVTAVKADDYAGAMAKVVPLKPFVDAFFDKVMVMAEDKALRENRVRLLMEIGGLFGTVADFSKIQAES